MSNATTPQNFLTEVQLEENDFTPHGSDTSNPGFTNSNLQLNPWSGTEGYFGLPLLQYENMFPPPNPGPESTMDWHSRNLRIHYLHLRYACAIFRYHLLTAVPYYSILHDSYSPMRRRRICAQSSWEVACTYFSGRHNMMLEADWVDPMGHAHVIDLTIIFETVRLHTSLPEKSSSSRI